MKRLCIALIRLYQRWISPLKSAPTCRFYPSCSAYAVEAFEKRGFFAGLILTVARILRCHPFTPGGYDPVPERGFFLRKRMTKKTENNDDGADEPPLICEDYLVRRERASESEDDQTDA